jgi:hypothetical protein
MELRPKEDLKSLFWEKQVSKEKNIKIGKANRKVGLLFFLAFEPDERFAF